MILLSLLFYSKIFLSPYLDCFRLMDHFQLNIFIYVFVKVCKFMYVLWCFTTT